MKRCPRCNREFVDDIVFCFDDGTPLMSNTSTQETVVLPTSPAVPHYVPAATLPTQTQKAPYAVIGIIFVLTIAAVGFGVAYFVSSPEKEIASPNKASNTTSQPDEDKKKLDEEKSRLEADNTRLAEERKRLDAERQKVEKQKQASGPLPPSTTAWTVDPPTNIRKAPNGAIRCVISTPSMITIINTPSIPSKTGAWYRTTACGGSDVVHSSQVSFR